MSPASPQLLVVEDEPTLRHLLVQHLQLEGFTVTAVDQGQAALEAIANHPPDLMVLDLMLPILDGFQVLQRLREAGSALPVLMLTARGAEEDRLRGLRLGADDYLVKPFSILELVARIQAILRRTQPTEARALRSDPLRILRDQRQVFAQGQSLGLTAQEFRIVEILTSAPGMPFSREELLQLAWGQEQEGARHRLNVHISNLRKKLAEAGPEAFITSVGRVGRGGYCWPLPVQPDSGR